MFSVNIGDHILPSAFRRGFSCDIQVKNVFVFQFFFHGDHSLVGHSARSAPSCPEVNQQYVSAEFGDDSRKEFFVCYFPDFIDFISGLLLVQFYLLE